MGDDTRVNSGPYLWLLGCQGHSARSGKAAVLSRPPLSSRAPAQMTWGTSRQRPFSAVHVQRTGHGSPGCHIFLLKMIKWWATHLGYGEHRKHPLPVPWPSERTLTLFAPAGFGEGVCSALGPTFSSEGRAPDGRPWLTPEGTCCPKAHLLQPGVKSGFFLQLTWLREGEAGLFRMRFGRRERQEIQRRMSL